MPGQNNLPVPNPDFGRLNDWLSKKQVMKFIDIERTTFVWYKKLGLKTCKIGNEEKVHIDDLDDFLRGFRK